MATDEFEDNDEGQDEGSKNPGRAYQRELEKKNSKLADEIEAAKAQAAAAVSLQKENAFLRAGIPIDSGVGKLYFKSYEGELTPEAIKAGATAEGLDLVPTSEQASVRDELNAEQTARQTSSSASGSSAPNEVAQIRAATTAKEIIAIAQKAGSTISYEQPWN